MAIATPAGRGGIGVVRLAGPEAVRIAAPMLRLKHKLEPGRAVFGELVEAFSEDSPEEVKIPTSTAQNAAEMGHPDPTKDFEDPENRIEIPTQRKARCVGQPGESGTDPHASLRSEGRTNASVPARAEKIDEVVVTYFAKPHS